MPTDINKGFDNGDLLRDIRVDILNPVTVKVRDLENRVKEAKDTAEHAFNSVTVDLSNKQLDFHGVQGGGTANLDGMFKEGVDLSIQGETGPAVTPITAIKFRDSRVRRVNGSPTEVSYDWKGIVEGYQVPLQSGTLAGGTQPTKTLFFKGAKEVIHTPGDITTIDITPADSMTASIPGKGISNPVAIKTIELEGETDSSELRDGKLTIHLNKGGGGGTVTNQNFKGFFDTLGDLISNVTDALNGRSFAYVKDSKLGANYYTAYWYVSNGWTELKQDPALLYTAPSAPTPSGVFSIKPNPGISVDANGQLNLDGLSTPQLPQYFVGFFPNLEELKTQVPNPIPFQTYAYVKGPAGGWLSYRSDKQGTASLWKIVAPLGSFSYVDEASSSYTQVYGIKRGPGWSVDSKGLLSFVGGGGVGDGINVGISDYNGTIETHDVKAMTFPRAKSLVDFEGANKDEIVMYHPQRIINYNATWESNHNSQNYEGNIFYDETSRCWMGYSIPASPGAVGAKWTRIAHEDMSLEVKDLVKRVPAKAKPVEAGITGDSASWAYNGITFMDKDSDGLPDEIKTICGGYITTVVQDKDATGVTIPQFRMQTCVADQEGGETYIRRLNATGSPGAAITWTPWVRTSFSKKDINAHEDNPSAHKNVIKYHKVTSVGGKFTEILAQYGGPGGTSPGFLRGSNCDLLVDNYGFTEGSDALEFPYPGKFRVRGEFFVSGYNKANYPASTWTVTLMKQSASGSQSLVHQYSYEHKDANVKYPPIFFIANDVIFEEGDKFYIRIQCPQSAAINTHNPNIYFVPLKSQIVVEDMGTLAGSKIGETYKKHLANLNAFGEIEVKAHYNEFKPDRAVRVYGDKVVKTPTEMKTII